MPVSLLLIAVGKIQQRRLAEVRSDQLQPNGKLPGKSAGDGYARSTGKIYGDRIDIVKVHLYRIVGFFA